MKKTFLVLLIAVSANFSQAADLTIAPNYDSSSIDPMEANTLTNNQLANILYDSLVRFNSKMEIEPRLATAWELINPTTMRFTLRQGVKFHNGDTMMADDVIFSFNRIQNSDFKGLFTPYSEMTKIDDYTVDLHMKAPYPLVLSTMTSLFIMDHKFFSGKDDAGQDKDLLASGRNTFASSHENGTGPFILTARQQSIKNEFTRFSDYWEKDTGNVDKLISRPIGEDATRVNALISGDVNWIYPMPATDIKRIQTNDNLEVYSIPTDSIVSIQMNQDVVPQFKDKRVREAVIYAINSEAIVKKILHDDGTPAGQNSPKGYMGYVADLVPRYDLQKAKELMAEAGYKDGFKVNLISPTTNYAQISQAVSSMLAKIGIKVTLTVMPTTKYWQDFDQCQAGMQIIGWAPDTIDSANYSQFLTVTNDKSTGLGQYNCNGYSNPKLDALVKASDTEIDPKKRSELLQEASKIEYDDAIMVPIYWKNETWAYQKSITNFPHIVNLRNFPHWELLIVKGAN